MAGGRAKQLEDVAVGCAMVEQDLITAEVVDLSTLGDVEPGALVSLSALEQEALVVFNQAALYYGLGAYPGKDHTMSVIQLQLRTIEEVGRIRREVIAELRRIRGEGMEKIA